MCCAAGGRGGTWFVGDDWAENHHDVEVQDAYGRRLVQAQLPRSGRDRPAARADRGVVGEDTEPGQVQVGIETYRGPWVAALLAVIASNS